MAFRRRDFCHSLFLRMLLHLYFPFLRFKEFFASLFWYICMHGSFGCYHWTVRSLSNTLCWIYIVFFLALPMQYF